MVQCSHTVFMELLTSRLVPNSATYTNQPGPANICSHIATDLVTHRSTLLNYFNKRNFSKHE